MHWRWILFCWLGFTSVGHPQGSNMAIRLANLEQDFRRVDQQVRAMSIDLEQVLRENAQLKQDLKNEIQSARQNLVSLTQLNQRLALFSKDVETSLAQSQKTTIDQVATQMEALAAQMQDALLKLSGSIGAAPAIETTVSFNDNFPKTGISYTVKNGDSLGKIARENNSTIDWIQNANRIAGDLIYPNQQLFIPQKD